MWPSYPNRLTSRDGSSYHSNVCNLVENNHYFTTYPLKFSRQRQLHSWIQRPFAADDLGYYSTGARVVEDEPVADEFGAGDAVDLQPQRSEL